MRAPCADADVVEQHRVGDRRAAAGERPRTDDAALEMRARQHRSERDDRVDGVADAPDRVADELRGRRVDRLRVDRPLRVVEVEDRQRRDEVLVRVEERLDRPDIAPVVAVAIGRPGTSLRFMS